MDDKAILKEAGVTIDRPNHELGCIYRYSIEDGGECNCRCPHKNDPDWVVQADWIPIRNETIVEGSMNWLVFIAVVIFVAGMLVGKYWV